MQDLDQIIERLTNESLAISVTVAEKKVPRNPGLYSIFVNRTESLPKFLSSILQRQNRRIIYIGKASKNLSTRLIEQDLRHKNPSTFFRSIGAVLGYRPAKGSLVGKKNVRNYKFSLKDTEGIINWINRNIVITWMEIDTDKIDELEMRNNLYLTLNHY